MADDEMTPRAMLELYRQHAHSHVRQQAELFNDLTVEERLELLFFMVANVTGIVQAKVAPAPTTGFDEVKRKLTGRRRH